MYRRWLPDPRWRTPFSTLPSHEPPCWCPPARDPRDLAAGQGFGSAAVALAGALAGLACARRAFGGLDLPEAAFAGAECRAGAVGAGGLAAAAGLTASGWAGAAGRAGCAGCALRLGPARGVPVSFMAEGPPGTGAAVSRVADPALAGELAATAPAAPAMATAAAVSALTFSRDGRRAG